MMISFIYKLTKHMDNEIQIFYSIKSKFSLGLKINKNETEIVLDDLLNAIINLQSIAV